MARSTLPTKSESSLNAIPPKDTNVWLQLDLAVDRREIDQAIREVYAHIDQAVNQRGPTCWISGRCCNFDTFGHRLYVTGLEIAWVLKQYRQMQTQPSAAPSQSINLSVTADGPCPLQVNGLCHIHLIRPMGCRIFFCQQGTESWQHQLYEQSLTQLRMLHDQHRLPYRYLEWRVGLAEAARCLPKGKPGIDLRTDLTQS